MHIGEPAFDAVVVERQALVIDPQQVKDRRVVVVDDSIVRGTTVRRRVTALREAGAKEIHVRISCPPVSHPCFFGIDFPTSEELIAGTQGVEAIRSFIGADSLGYLSVEGLLSPLKNPRGYCSACFTGRYPVEGVVPGGKKALENAAVDLQLDFNS